MTDKFIKSRQSTKGKAKYIKYHSFGFQEYEMKERVENKRTKCPINTSSPFLNNPEWLKQIIAHVYVHRHVIVDEDEPNTFILLVEAVTHCEPLSESADKELHDVVAEYVKDATETDHDPIGNPVNGELLEIPRMYS